MCIIFIQYSYQENHYIVLGNDYSVVDGVQLNSQAYNGVLGEKGIVTISEAGSYVLNGEFNGKVRVKLSDANGQVTLTLDGVKITNPSGTGLLIENGRELDSTQYSNGNGMTASKANSLDFSKAGIKVIIADDSTNIINASHDSNHDAAFFSKFLW